jgi:hypothetical protein
MSDPLDTGDDLGPAYLAQRQAAAADDVLARMQARIGAASRGGGHENAAKPGAPGAPAGGGGLTVTRDAPAADDEQLLQLQGAGAPGLGAMAGGIWRNARDMPLQAVGGVSDAVHNTFSALDSLAWWLESKAPLGTFDGVNPLLAIAGPEERVPEAKTPAGAMTRDVSRFLVGFLPLFRGARSTAAAAGATGAVAEVGAAAAAGAATDFFTRSPTEENLANLVQSHEALRNPVTEYLMARPEDGEAEARFKKGLEGAGLGLLGDGLVAAVKAIRSARSGGQTIDRAAADLAAQRAKYGSVDPERDFLILGDPRAPLVKTSKLPQPELLAAGQRARKLDKADRATETGVPDDIAAKGLVRAGEAGGEAVYVNFARIAAPEDVKKALGQMTEAFARDIDEARRGVQSNEETARLASELGLTTGDLLARRKGQPFNAEEALAARRLWTASAEKLTELAEKAAGVNASAVDQFNFRKMMSVHYAIQAEVVAARTETARALQSWSIPAGSGTEQARAIQDMLDGMGGVDVSRAMAQRLAALKAQGADPASLNAAIRKGAWATSMDAVKEIYINALLSSPTTHIVNTASNSMVALQQIFERGAAERISAITGSGGVAPGEAAAMTFGLVNGLKDAFRLSWRAMRDDQTGAALGKMDINTQAAVSSKAFAEGAGMTGAAAAAFSQTALGRAVDYLGTATRIPTRMLGAEDEFFKTIGYRMEVYAQAWRQASAEGLTGEAAGQRVAQLALSPPENIRLAATDAALYATFTNKPGDFAEALLKLRNSNSVMILVLPFVKTPANIMSYAFERSPAAPLVGRFREDLAAGGARADLALARMATGSSIMAIAADLAETGVLTGAGPDDPGERETLERQGWQAYSLKVGGRYYSFQRSDPLGMTLGLAADLSELVRRKDIEPQEVDEINEMIAGTIAAISRTAISKTYLQGVSELVEMLAAPERYSEGYINDLFAGFVPSISNAAARAIDPGMKETMDIMDAFAQRIPGLRQSLTPARDLWGAERRPQEIYGRAYEVLSPVKVSAARASPIDAEMQRLNLDQRRITKRLNWDGVDVDLKDWPQVYDAYVRLAGNELKHPAWGKGARDFLNDVVDGKSDLSEVYRLKSEGEDGGKATFIKDAIGQFRRLARREIMADPQFSEFADWIRGAQDRARAAAMPAAGGAPGASPGASSGRAGGPVVR